MKTQTLTLTHITYFSCPTTSSLRKDFPIMGKVPQHEGLMTEHWVFTGTLVHVPFLAHNGGSSYGIEGSNVAEVTSPFILGKRETIVCLNGKRYVASINFGFNRSVLALSILGIEGEELTPCIFTNSVKLYTTTPSTPEFLKGKPLFQL